MVERRKKRNTDIFLWRHKQYHSMAHVTISLLCLERVTAKNPLAGEHAHGLFPCCSSFFLKFLPLLLFSFLSFFFTSFFFLLFLALSSFCFFTFPFFSPLILNDLTPTKTNQLTTTSHTQRTHTFQFLLLFSLFKHPLTHSLSHYTCNNNGWHHLAAASGTLS